MKKIKIAILGVGNCASSLIQGIEYYKQTEHQEHPGLMHWSIGGYNPYDIQVVAAFDIDKRKVGKDIAEAIFAPPNCAKVIYPEVPKKGIKVTMGKLLDGFPEHMENFPEDQRFILANVAELSEDEVIKVLKESEAEILVNYLPVGSQEATFFYINCALKAKIAVVNCIPVFIASNSLWENKFREINIPIIGDDIKSQIGATIIHRVLADLFNKRGVKLDRTYQLNTGGNTDFLNMLDCNRLSTKKVSKTEAFQSMLDERLTDSNIHIGPSDYVSWQKDNKICFIRMEGRGFGHIPINLELRLSVEDSPNSAGVVIDAIRCCKLALERKIGGVLDYPSAFFMKHPPKQLTDEQAYKMTEKFIIEGINL